MKRNSLRFLLAAATATAFLMGGCAATKPKSRTLTASDYLDRMRGGWIGQIIGVGWALPTEFKYPSRIVPADDVPEWTPGRIDQHFNDDIFFNIEALKFVQSVGFDLSDRELAIRWLNSKGRRSGVAYRGRSGVAPPDLHHPQQSGSGKWSYANLHMMSDFAGLVAPGMPNQAAEIIDRFTFKCCETRYDGRFVAAMTAEAFFEKDPERLVRAGLRVVPPESQYAEAVRDVLAWHRKNPDDWQATWHLIQKKYFEREEYLHRLDPGPGTGDAKIHGAYVVLGLLYGKGDLARSIELTMRCGQDSDCSASNVGGILGVALGESKIPHHFTSQLDLEQPFNNVNWNLRQTFEACEDLARRAVLRAGGRIHASESGTTWEVSDIPYEAGPYIRWWAPPALQGSRFSDSEMRRLRYVSLAWALQHVYPIWEARNANWSSTFEWEAEKRRDVITLEPRNRGEPVVLTGTIAVSSDGPTNLHLAASGNVPWQLQIRANGRELATVYVVDTPDETWTEVEVDLSTWRGDQVNLEIVAGARSQPVQSPQPRKQRSAEMRLAGLPTSFGP